MTRPGQCLAARVDEDIRARVQLGTVVQVLTVGQRAPVRGRGASGRPPVTSEPYRALTRSPGRAGGRPLPRSHPQAARAARRA